MNFQGGFSIQQPEEIHLGSSWMPVTPEKPPILARSNSVPDNPNGSQALGMANWLEPATNYNCLAQIFNANPQVGRMPERFGYDGNPNTNGIAGSYEEQSLLVGGEDWNNIPFMQLLQQGGDSDFVTTNRTLTRDVQLAAERPLVPISPTETSNFLGDCSSSGGFSSGSSFRPEIANAHCQVGNSWIGSGPSLLLRQGTQYSASDMLDNGNIIPKKIQYYFPTTLRPNYDLNSSSSINPSALTNVSNSLVFTPVTPDQASNKEKQRSTMFTSSVPKSSSHEKDGMGNLVQYMGEEAIQQHGSELLQNIVESSSTVVCTSHEEKTGSDKKVDLGIDLNKTPQQKPPKRKKHRPKVIVEGKPKRPRKPAVPKDTVSKENRPKRKYVRKNVPKDLTAQEADVTGETREPDNGTTQKTCKRVLDFDLEKTSDEIQANVVGQQEVQTMNKSTTSTTGDYQAMRPRNGTNHTWGTMPSTQNGLPKGLMAENQIPGKTSGTHFTSQMTPDRQAAVAPLASTKDGQMKNLYVTGRHELNANAHQWQNRAADKCTPMQQQTQGDGTGQEILQGKAHNGNLERAKRMLQLERIKLMMQILPQQAPRTPSKFYEARGSKREHSQTTGDNHSTANHMGSSLYGKILQVDESHRNGHPLHAAFFQTHKKKKIGDDYRDSPNLPSNVKAADGGLGKERTHDANPTGQKSRMNSAILYSHIESSRLTDRGNDQVNNVTSDRYIHPMALGQNSPKQQISSQIHSHTRRMGSTMGLNPINSFSTQTTIARYNHLIHIPSVPEISTGPGNGQIFQTCYNSMSEKRQTMGAPLLKLASSGVNKPQELSAKRRGTKKKQVPTLVDEITYRLQNLDLNRSGNGLPMQDQNALVLYKADGAIVPYDGLEFLKKRKPRPKVDLDPETNRIWNLLMGKEGSEDLEGTNKDKEKWWEEERKVFRGRVDSFIARMHLVQGDRRFSPWKGSVVDSVIGVFLTQNVSDHLSSSAFMSLAARFPLKSSYNTQDKAEPDITDRQAPISILNLDDNIKWHEVSSQPINSRNITPHDAAENQWVRQTERSLTEARNQSLDEEFILSQDSFDSTITQVAGGIRSCSGSNSETEDPCTSCKHSNVQLSALTHYLQMEKTTSVQEVRGHVNGSTVSNEKSKHGLVEYDWLKSRSDAMKHLDFPSSAYSNNPDYLYMQPTGPSRSIKLHMMHNSGLPEVWYTETFSDESTSSWHSTASGSTKGPEAVSKNSKTGELTGNFGNSTKELNGERRSQAAPTTDSYPLLSTHLTNQQGIPQPVPHVGYNHQSFCSNYQHERNNMFHLEGTSSTEPVKLAEAHAKMQTANTENVTKFSRLREKTFEGGDSISTVSVQTHKENRLAEPNLKEQPSSHHASDAANTKISKVKKGNTENQKKNEVNWDNLRKHVESNGGKRQRGKDSMDSLDYETLRNANVNEISNAIKERGMNNMLAERIKEFLNRLVREHGSIDLEWLRDVPPDKAKDYLLSIRGLGLKSVECVRLLTLHHLAFPVDTNVGRIAVRLGWVPLQPLPESLQLHLLELYPMLESIQKYLWPRLCKLDQRTLYELHYQMITFGKVFCTKSKPNCNACPMRGECRHFASAFASARLALPGPEERGIVSSTVPIPTEEPPAVVIHPMALPPPGNDLVKEVGSRTGKCEPIIEEPATPEQECTEISQSDIEDAFYEDPDEIPTIKLNIEKFTENLQTYMEKSMDIQESDMSKALVALTPDVASIPIPKLKNVNRLRTEHQVYELPDSHPLLERLDRREPDDPSPYLLAIWTPGETANSIQPSERSCGSQEPGKFCNDETCFSCNSMREANSQTVRGTVLIPCRTAMRGSFPLNGTYFQVNEVFADHDSSLNPINVPREWLWNLQRRMVYFGTSVTSIFRGLSTEGIQYCFWKGFVCVRGFDMTTRAPRPLMARLHFPASKLARAKNDNKR